MEVSQKAAYPRYAEDYWQKKEEGGDLPSPFGLWRTNAFPADSIFMFLFDSKFPFQRLYSFYFHMKEISKILSRFLVFEIC